MGMSDYMIRRLGKPGRLFVLGGLDASRILGPGFGDAMKLARLKFAGASDSWRFENLFDVRELSRFGRWRDLWRSSTSEL